MKALKIFFIFTIVITIFAPIAMVASKFIMRLITDTPETLPQGKAVAWSGEELMKQKPGSQVKGVNTS